MRMAATVFKGSSSVKRGNLQHTSYKRQLKIPQIPYYHSPCHLAKGEEKDVRIILCSWMLSQKLSSSIMHTLSVRNVPLYSNVVVM